VYQKVSKTIAVPKNVGADGFLHALKNILRVPRVQKVVIDAGGKVTYDYFKVEGSEDTVLGLDFDSLAPGAVVRTVEMQELELVEDDKAPVVMCHLFRMCRISNLVPIALVTGANTLFWKWHDKAGVRGMEDTPHDAYGLSILFDEIVPDEVILLCAGYSKESTLIDSVKVFKAVMLT